MPFSITPLTDIPPPAAENFPNFIQFQDQGTDLGLPDADTLNFGAGLSATRGVGENSNVVSVTTLAPAPGVLKLSSLPDPPAEGIWFFDGALFYEGWAGVEIQIPNDSWTWNGLTGSLTFNSTGLYQVIATCYIDADIEWPAGATTYGSQIGDPDTNGSRGVQARYHDAANPSDTRTRMQWTDQHILNVETDGEEMAVGLFAISSDDQAPVLFSGMHLVINRLSDPV